MRFFFLLFRAHSQRPPGKLGLFADNNLAVYAQSAYVLPHSPVLMAAALRRQHRRERGTLADLQMYYANNNRFSAQLRPSRWTEWQYGAR
jgi:hypothetical protein